YLGSDLAEPEHDDVPNLQGVERLENASHWCITTTPNRSTSCSSTSSALPSRPERRADAHREEQVVSETTNSENVTVVLVHGAFADASSWNGVIARLQAKGVPVTAPPNPLRGISVGSAYLASVLEQIDGPVPRGGR